jgi:hypothetical protein
MKTRLLAAAAAAVIGLSVAASTPAFAQVSAAQRDAVNNGVNMLGGVPIEDINALSDDQVMNIQMVLEGDAADEAKRDQIKLILEE